MKSFISRFYHYWTRAAAQRLWNARTSFGVWSFALICLSILATPFLRTVFEVQNSRDSLSLFASGEWQGNAKRPAAFYIEHIYALHPDDRNVELAFAEGENRDLYADDGEEYAPVVLGSLRVRDTQTQRYAKLMQKWPRDPVPVALWLRQTNGEFVDIRVAGVLENPPTPTPMTPPLPLPLSSSRQNVIASPAVSPPSSEFLPAVPNAPNTTPMATPQPSALKSAIESTMSSALAQTPDADATPAPTPSYTQSQLNRAITIAKIGQKLEPKNSYFDWKLIYFLLCARRDDEAIRVLDAASRKPHYDDYSCDMAAAFIRARERIRPTLIEEKWPDVYNRSGESYLDKDAHVVRLLSWLAWQKEQSGDTQSALSIRAAVARLADVMSGGRRTHWDSRQQFLRVIWRYDLRPLFSVSRAPAPRIRPSLHADADKFAAFAQLNGRLEIAHETQNIVQKAADRNLLHRRYGGFLFSRIFVYSLLSNACLWAIKILLALYVALSILLLLSRPVEVARRDVWTMTPFLALAALAGVFCLHFALSQPPTGSDTYLDLTQETPPTLWLLGIGVVLLFGAPILGNGLWCALTAWWRERQTSESKAVASGLTILRYAFFFVLASSWFYAIAYSVVAFVMLQQGASSWSVTLPALGEIVFREPWQNLFFMWPIVAAFSLVSWFFYARLFAAPPRTQTLYALRRFRQTLLSLVPIYAALWILVALLSIPQRRLAQTQLDDLLRHGEVYVAQNRGKYR